MRNIGFNLIKMIVSGKNKVNAEIDFKNGLNVICGPSDTGKTYILQCIDYVLGGGSLPKEIPEAEQYSHVMLKLEDKNTNEIIILERSLKVNSSTKIIINDGIQENLNSKHVDDDSSLSYRLLKRISLNDNKIRKNKNNVTRSLSFRDIIHLCIISEEEIISEKSPIHSMQYTKYTEESSIFSLLLSGNDYSELIPLEDKKISKARIEGKLEIIRNMINDNNNKIEEKGYQNNTEQAHDDLEKNDEKLSYYNGQLMQLKASSNELENERQSEWSSCRRLETKVGVNNELLKRFELLDRQYYSDIERLLGISETSDMLNTMELVMCPLCGSNTLEELSNIDYENLSKACESEVNKIEKLIKDLQDTRLELNRETEKLVNTFNLHDDKLKKIESKLENDFKPQIMHIVDMIQKASNEKVNIKENIALLNQIAQLKITVETLNRREKDKTINVVDDSHTYLLDKFSKYVKERLVKWSYPNIDRVYYNNDLDDLVISGRDRKSHGKGVRAIFYSAFIISLLRYCIENSLPHSGFVILDSPLVVFREPDKNDEILSDDIKAKIYIDLATDFCNEQIIIIENNEPPADIEKYEKINLIKFTKNETFGRFGFIPAQKKN